jgi:hypothetical protein
VGAGTIAAIEAAIDEANVARFAPRYEQRNVTDLPTTVTTVRLGDGAMSEFRRYHGDPTAPADLVALEAELSRLMGLDAWLGRAEPVARGPIVVPIFVFHHCRVHGRFGAHVHDRDGRARRVDPNTPGYGRDDGRGGHAHGGDPGRGPDRGDGRGAIDEPARGVDDPRDARPSLPTPTRSTPELRPVPFAPMPPANPSTPNTGLSGGGTPYVPTRTPALAPAVRTTPERPTAPAALAPVPSRPTRVDLGDRPRAEPNVRPAPAAPPTRFPTASTPPPAPARPAPRTIDNVDRTPRPTPRPAPSAALPSSTPRRGTVADTNTTELKPIPKRTPTSPLIGR